MNWNMFGLPMFTINTNVNNRTAEGHPLWIFHKGAEITEKLTAGGTGMFSCCMVQASTNI